MNKAVEKFVLFSPFLPSVWSHLLLRGGASAVAVGLLVACGRLFAHDARKRKVKTGGKEGRSKMCRKRKSCRQLALAAWKEEDEDANM